MATQTELPADEGDWFAHAESLNIRPTDRIHAATDLRSASNISRRQYILLRSYVQRQTVNEFSSLNHDWLDDTYYEHAKKLLSSFSEWRAYLISVHTDATQFTDENKFRPLGSFALVRQLQLQSMKVNAVRPGSYQTSETAENHRGPPCTPPSKFLSHLGGCSSTQRLPVNWSPDRDGRDEVYAPSIGAMARDIADDESIVNAALFSLAQALILHFPEVKAEWSMHRARFTMRQPGTNSKVYEARVDGVLIFGQEVKMIMEVKPHTRYTVNGLETKVTMQETAQFSSWISQNPPKPRPGKVHTRLMISQSRNEVYLNVASFDDAYVAYVCGTSLPDGHAHLMRIEQWGPFYTNVAKHMSRFGKILLAYVMKNCCSG